MSEVKTETKQDVVDHINLKVQGQDGSIVHFKIKKHTPLKKLMVTYCERTNLDIKQLRFRFDGEAIREHNTPKELNMEEGDFIEVFTQQTGGDGDRPHSKHF